MKNLVKILALFLAVSCLFGGTSISFSAHADNGQEIYYGVENGEAYVECQPTWVTGDIVIASTYEGYPVTRFSEPTQAYIFSKNVTSITLPDSISASELTGYPFCGCPNAEIIISPDNPGLCLEGNVLYSKDKTRLIRYQNNPNSKSFTIPESVTEVAEAAFGNSDLEELTILNSKTKINYCDGFDYHNITDIYYYGTEDEWNADYDNVAFQDQAEVHFMANNSSDSVEPEEPAQAFDIVGFFVEFFKVVSENLIPFLKVFLVSLENLINELI